MDRQTERQTDEPHKLHVYVGLAQARLNNLLEHSLINLQYWLGALPLKVLYRSSMLNELESMIVLNNRDRCKKHSIPASTMHLTQKQTEMHW